MFPYLSRVIADLFLMRNIHLPLFAGESGGNKEDISNNIFVKIDPNFI